MKSIKIFYFASLAILAFSIYSCREVELIADDLDIPNLGGTEKAVKTDLDYWLEENFLNPYNINVIYDWDASQMMTSTIVKVVPVEEKQAYIVMDAIAKIWFTPYIEAGSEGPVFIKKYAPKTIALVGSPEFQSGSIKLGQAEGARKILLLNVNDFDSTDEYKVKQALNTIEHEFAHILHQTRMFDKEAFHELNVEGISYRPSSWTDVSETQAWTDGFVSPYSMSAVEEDFVETISRVMVYGLDWFNNTVRARASAEAKVALDLKLDFVNRYFIDVWGINFLDTDYGEKGLVSYVKDAIDDLLDTPQNP